MANIKKFFPTGGEIFQVLGVTLFTVHSWSIRTFIFNLPSFILYMNPGQVAGVFAYMMAFAFLESLLIISLLLIVGAVLPHGWYRDQFTSRAFLTILVGAGLAINVRLSMPNHYPGVEFLYSRVLISAIILSAAILAAHFIAPVQRILDFLTQQFSVMTYIYFPIGLASLIVVVARNIF